MATKKTNKELPAINVVADQIRKQARLYQAFTDTADALDQIGIIQNHITELEGRRDKLIAEESKAKQSIIDAESEAKQVKKKEAAAVSKLKGDGQAAIDDANAKAKKIVDDAVSASKEVFYKGTKAELAELDNMRRGVMQTKLEASSLNDTRATLLAEVESMTAEYNEIRGKLLVLKAQMAKVA